MVLEVTAKVNMKLMKLIQTLLVFWKFKSMSMTVHPSNHLWKRIHVSLKKQLYMNAIKPNICKRYTEEIREFDALTECIKSQLVVWTNSNINVNAQFCSTLEH